MRPREVALGWRPTTPNAVRRLACGSVRLGRDRRPDRRRPVTAEQMRAMFGCGLHPLAETRQQQLDGPSLSPRDHRAAARLGAPFKILDGHVGPLPPRGGKTLRGDQYGGRPSDRQAPPRAGLHRSRSAALATRHRASPSRSSRVGPVPDERSQLVANLADQVRHSASQEGVQPVWAPPGSHPNATLLGEIAVWRAAIGVDPQDRRPTGEPQLQMASALLATATRPSSRPVQSPASRRCSETRDWWDPLEITGTKIDIGFPQHPLCIRVSRLGPACERRRQRWSVA